MGRELLCVYLTVMKDQLEREKNISFVILATFVIHIYKLIKNAFYYKRKKCSVIFSFDNNQIREIQFTLRLFQKPY